MDLILINGKVITMDRLHPSAKAVAVRNGIIYAVGRTEKIYGSLGARTAYLKEPYADEPSTRGIPVYTQDELDSLVMTAHRAGMQVAIHCIGDKAMYMAFENIEKAQREIPRKNSRHSIIHCQITDKTLLDKFKDLDMVAHIQPIFLDYDLHIVESRINSQLSIKNVALQPS